MKIEIVMSSSCPYCINAVKWLDTHNVPHTKTIMNDYRERLPFYEKHGVSTVPQIFVDDFRIGGFSDLVVSDFAKKVISGEITFDK